MVVKKQTTKEAAGNVAEPKKTTTRKACSTKVAIALNAENVGFKAGDVYQALAAADSPLTVKEIAKAAGICEGETLLGMGWLFKEGKIVSVEEDKIALA